MSPALEVRVFENQKLVFVHQCEAPFRIGRQKSKSEHSLSAFLENDKPRIVIAPSSESTVPRQITVESLVGDEIRIRNESTASPVAVQGVGEVRPGDSCVVPLPVLLTLGSRAVRIQLPEAPAEELYSLAEATLAPGSHRTASPPPALTEDARADRVQTIRWFQVVLELLQSAVGTDEFFARAERAVVDALGMDSGRVLLLDSAGQWQFRNPRPGEPPPSRHVLDHVQREKRTFWAVPKTVMADSVRKVQAIAAAPILSKDQSVIGALYGDRRGRGRTVTEVDAVLMELLAGAVAAGLARIEQERAMVEAQVRFEQFFQPELARSLSANPDMLQGHQAQVTVLFADVRGYSRVAERLGAEETAGWMREVLGALSGCVRDEGGVLIDYVGDELLAMWGAPTEQPDHAIRAARAAQAMLRQVPKLGQRWHEHVGEPLHIGIGAHSGPAWVGEVGTDHKFKYGPRGHTVNLASRVQGTTKYTRVPAVITGAMRSALDDSFTVRRLTKVRVVNINDPVELFEIVADPPANWSDLRDGYEEALTMFEQGDARSAARKISALVSEFRGDGPSLLLVKRAVDVLFNGEETYDPVWELPGK